MDLKGVVTLISVSLLFILTEKASVRDMKWDGVSRCMKTKISQARRFQYFCQKKKKSLIFRGIVHSDNQGKSCMVGFGEGCMIYEPVFEILM